MIELQGENETLVMRRGVGSGEGEGSWGILVISHI